MSELDVKPDKPPDTPKPKPGMSLRSVATITGAVAGTAGAVTLLAVGGWIAVAGGTVAVVGAGYARHRMKNPRRPTGRRSTGGKPTWPLTGNQSRRALLPRGSRSSTGRGTGRTGTRASTPSLSGGRKSGKGLAGRAGSLLPKTTRSRARAGAGGVLPKHKASRPLSRTTTKAGRSAGVATRPPRLPKTPSRTPAKPGSASRLMGGKSSMGRKPGSPSSTRKGGRSLGRGNGSSLLPKRLTPGRSSTRRPSLIPGGRSGKSGSTARRKTGLGGRLSTKGNGRSLNPLKRISTKGNGRSLNPLKRISPSGLHSRTRNPLKRTTATPGRRAGRTTKRARRLGTPKAATTPNRSPNRSPARLRPFKRATARKLIRIGLGMPVRKGRIFKRPTKAQQRRARRTIWLRTRTRIWALRKLPGKYARWHWDKIWTKVPKTPDPAWRQTTIPLPKVKALPGPKHSIPAPSPTTTEVPKMSSPHEVISEAFSQLAQFQPESASEMERFLAMQHELFTNIGQSYTVLADRMGSDMPFGPAVADSTRDLGAAFSGLAGLAQDVHATFRQEHEAELARLETPRPNEQLWDTGAQ